MNNLGLYSKDILKNRGTFGVNKEGDVIGCSELSCKDCIFNVSNCDCLDSKDKVEWMAQELPRRHYYIEKLNLEPDSIGYIYLQEENDTIFIERNEQHKIKDYLTNSLTLDTYNLEISFFVWMYENINNFMDYNEEALYNYRGTTVEIRGHGYSIKEAVDMILMLLATYLSLESFEEDDELTEDILYIWSKIIKYMWW